MAKVFLYPQWPSSKSNRMYQATRSTQLLERTTLATPQQTAGRPGHGSFSISSARWPPAVHVRSSPVGQEQRLSVAHS